MSIVVFSLLAIATGNVGSGSGNPCGLKNGDRRQLKVEGLFIPRSPSEFRGIDKGRCRFHIADESDSARDQRLRFIKARNAQSRIVATCGTIVIVIRDRSGPYHFRIGVSEYKSLKECKRPVDQVYHYLRNTGADAKQYTR
jgi:hypothetical protein